MSTLLRSRERGMALLYTVAWPPQGIYVKKPIQSAADLKGVKWRAYSPATARIAELVGAQPVTVQAAELSQAMATGVVESYMSSGSTGVDSKTYEHIKYWYDTQAWLPKNAVIVNKAAFDALDAPTKQAVMKAAADAETRGWTASKRVNTESVEKLKANGMNIVQPSAQLKADMKKVGDTMLKEWLEKAGPEGKAMVDAANRSGKKFQVGFMTRFQSPAQALKRFIDGGAWGTVEKEVGGLAGTGASRASMRNAVRPSTCAAPERSCGLPMAAHIAFTASASERPTKTSPSSRSFGAMSLIIARPTRVVCLMASFWRGRSGSLVIQQIIASMSWLGFGAFAGRQIMSPRETSTLIASSWRVSAWTRPQPRRT